MNNEIRHFFTSNNYVIKKITIKGKVIIVDVLDKLFVVKKRDDKLENLFRYLTSRSFLYFPKIIYHTDSYDFYGDNNGLSEDGKGDYIYAKDYEVFEIIFL